MEAPFVAQVNKGEEERGGWRGSGTLRGGWAAGKDLGEVPKELLLSNDMPSSVSSLSSSGSRCPCGTLSATSLI